MGSSASDPLPGAGSPASGAAPPTSSPDPDPDPAAAATSGRAWPPSGSPTSSPAPAAASGRAWPRIGLPTYVETARWGVWERPAALLPHSYVAAVVAAGGVPVLLPPVVTGPTDPADPTDTPDPAQAAPGVVAGPIDPTDPSASAQAATGAGGRTAASGAHAAAARRAVDGLDALLLTGGADVEPSRYGAEPLATTQSARPDRDRWEADLLAEALARDLPVLAVCRGAQVLNVAAGGSLHQHVPDLIGHTGHQPGPAVLGATPVRLTEGSLAATILGTEVKVPCYHHQSIDRLGTDVEAVGWADDGVIEAVELRGRRFVLGVQWHPEDGDDLRLFEALVAAAQAQATRASGEAG